MRLLVILKGREPTPPPHVQEAIEAVALNGKAAEEAHSAVRSYWQARKETRKKQDAAIQESYARADRERRGE